MYYAYVLRSQRNGRFYYGSTNDWQRRLVEHNNGKNISTKYLRPWELVHLEEYQSLLESRRRELFFKSGQGRSWIKDLLKIKKD